MKEKRRRELKLPKRCECGGLMEYDESFGQVWSVCSKCSPVITIDAASLETALKKGPQP